MSLINDDDDDADGAELISSHLPTECIPRDGSSITHWPEVAE